MGICFHLFIHPSNTSIVYKANASKMYFIVKLILANSRKYKCGYFIIYVLFYLICFVLFVLIYKIIIWLLNYCAHNLATF